MELIFRSAPRQVNPGAAKIGCVHPDSGIDQHFSGFDTVGLHRNAGHDSPDVGKYLATDFPRVVPPPHGADTSAPGKDRQMELTSARLIAADFDDDGNVGGLTIDGGRVA